MKDVKYELDVGERSIMRKAISRQNTALNKLIKTAKKLGSKGAEEYWKDRKRDIVSAKSSLKKMGLI